MKRAWARAGDAVLWIGRGYRPDPKPFAILRIVIAIQILIAGPDLLWVGRVPAEFYNPPPGPFTLLTEQPSMEFLLAVTILRVVVAFWLLLGWKTLAASASMTAVLLITSGLTYSFSKVDHFILYDLAPLAFGLAGWGAAWSVDAIRRRERAVTDGYPVLLFGIVIGFAFFTAAIPKAFSGWLSPSREATHLFVARDVFDGPVPGPLTNVLMSVDSSVFWKLLDFATVFAEGWLIVAVFAPGLFRIGLLVLAMFHVGVFLSLGIDFFANLFVYAGFFCLPIRKWFPEIALLTSIRRRRETTVIPVPTSGP